MHIAGIKEIDVANGPGCRVSIWVSGCDIHCPGCFNPSAWDFNFGEPYDEDCRQRIIEAVNKPYITGVTILGGEPLHHDNVDDVTDLCSILRDIFGSTISIWVYTGYNWRDVRTLAIMDYIDCCVSGPFIEEKKILGEFRGSSNQEFHSRTYAEPTELDIRKHKKKNKKMEVYRRWINGRE